MNPPSSDVHKALDLVDRVPLEHPAPALLRAYILEAVQPQAAANYVQHRLSADGHAGSLVADWTYVIDSVISGKQPRAPSAKEINAITKRDGGLCCVTGKKGSLWDPVIVAPVLPVPSAWLKGEPRVAELLEVFFGPQYFDWWRFLIDRADIYSPYETHWLVRRSVHNAFQRGVVKLMRLPSSMVEFRVEHVLMDDEQPVDVKGPIALLGDHSRQGIEKADARLIGSHARFSRSIQLVNLARTIAPSLFSEPKTTTDVPQQQFLVRMRSSSLGLGYTFVRPIVLLWRFFPSKVRIAAYDLLRKLGSCFYGKDGNAQVQRLPFGLYLKYNSDSDTLRNEYNALKVLEQKTNIPAPLAFDIVSLSNNEDDLSYLLMSRVPGTPLAICRDSLSDQDYANLSVQLKGCVSQIRDIPKPANHDMVICNTLGEACRDPRIRDWSPIGPFADEASFSQNLRFSDEPSRRGHKIVFTHGDLNPRNIMMERISNSAGATGWRLSGIIDWETAGYYPDYWDYTKSMFESFRWPRRHNVMMSDVFSEFGDYSEELAVERRAWESGDGI
ncbi:ubiquitin interaction domain-containing protein [Fusarium bulbicola]|nr:ubiquitin interaction domain-containing protein [Fusarium bulbicola]